MDVESIIEHAVLSLNAAAGRRLTRQERQRLQELDRYIAAQEALGDQVPGALRPLWDDDLEP